MNRNQLAVWMPLAERFLEAGDTVKAVGCLEHLAELWPHLLDEWDRAWSVYMDAGQAEAFLERLMRDVERFGGTNAHWLRLAELNENLGWVTFG